MIAPLNSPDLDLPSRLRHFTDREEALAAFDTLWPGDGAWVLAFDGLSGSGKTTLIDYLIETRCKPKRMPWAILDFEGSRGLTLRTDWRALLDTLAGQWGLAEHPTYTTGREVANNRYEAIRHTLQVQIDQIAEQGQIMASPITIDANQSQALRRADEQARHDTCAALLQAAIATPWTTRPLALFLDTYELVAGAADKEYAGWLWSWLANAATRLPSLRVIVGSREKLDGLTRRERRQQNLPIFDRDQSSELLTKLGVSDPAWRVAVFERLAGGHPLLTEMAADLWREAQASGPPLPVEAIPTLAGQEHAVEWLTGRILDRLEVPLKNAVRWAALLRRFDQETLVAVLPDETGRLSDDDFERLRRYSFVASARVGRGWACHDLLRRVQNAYLATNKPQARRDFHARAAALFAAEADEVEAIYHWLMAGEAAAPAGWIEATHAAYLRLDWPRWAALLEIVESPELFLLPNLQAEAHFWRGQWHRWRYEMDAALDSYQQALALFRAVGARLGEANTLQAIGTFHLGQGEYKEALQLLDQALKLYQQIGDRVGQANLYWSLGLYLAQHDALREAESLIAQAVALGNQFAPGHPVTLQMERVLEQVRSKLTDQT